MYQVLHPNTPHPLQQAHITDAISPVLSISPQQNLVAPVFEFHDLQKELITNLCWLIIECKAVCEVC